MGAADFRIVSISALERFLIAFLAICNGCWVLCKHFFKKLWDPNSTIPVPRDKPPTCLVDSTLGQHQYVKLQGIKYHYVEAGQENHPTILLLHGFPDCWLGWRYQIPVLSTHFRVIALDLKGFGDTEKPIWRRSYKIKTILKELKQFIKLLGVNECILIGHDLGALLGWYLVHDSPELILKFVSVSCPHPNVYWKTLKNENVFNTSWMHFVQLPYLPEIDAMWDDLKLLSKAHKHLKHKTEEEYLQAYKYSFSRNEDWVGPMNYYRNLPYVRVCETSEQIRVSTLIIQGDQNSGFLLQGFVRSTEYCENSNLRIIEAAGHFPHQENPDQFNKEVLKFLRIGRVIKSEDSPTKSIMGRMFGAGSTIVKYGNSVLVNVQNKTKTGVINNIPNMGVGLIKEAHFVNENVKI
ncbi:hypothetical protein FQR65_LT08787 [Abscondita terminalis]|nr:hypothetical protein FQR65_LT08787 [Abscondita terminalis]